MLETSFVLEIRECADEEKSKDQRNWRNGFFDFEGVRDGLLCWTNPLNLQEERSGVSLRS